MHAMQLSKPGTSDVLELVERPLPRPEPGELLVQVLSCGVCRTDLQLAEGALDLHRRPVVPGHQAVGRVVARGSKSSSLWREGDRVGVGWLGGACGACRRCLEGRENLCREAEFTGWDRDGGFATHMIIREDFALHIPDRFADDEAAPLLCGGVIGYRSLEVSGIKRNERLGLFGFGASAHLALQVARHWGCAVHVFTRSSAERERAEALGAVWTGGYEEVPPEPLDAAITFAPVGSVVVAALKVVDRGGTVAINAIHLDGIPAFDYQHLWWERNLRSVANFTRDDARRFLAIASEIPLRPSFDVYPLAEANRALAALAAGNVHGAAVLSVS